MMKKYIFSLMAALTLSSAFVSCGNDNEDKSITYTQSAEEMSAGTYNGTWTRQMSGDENIDTYTGTVTLAAKSNGLSDLTTICTDASLNLTAAVNIWHSDNGCQFSNKMATDFGAKGVAGRVDDSGILTVSFTITQRVGKKSYEYLYRFEGTKN